MKVSTTKEIHLVLNETEAQWLKAVMQNPLSSNSVSPEIEGLRDREIRGSFWRALDEAKIA